MNQTMVAEKTDMMTMQCLSCGKLNWHGAKFCSTCSSTMNEKSVAVKSQQQIKPVKEKVKKSFSQKVARGFEIVDYFLLLPGAYGLFMSFVLIGSAPWFPLIIATWFVLGCLLLRGFFRHSRGRLTRAQALRLWGFTMAYNMVHVLIAAAGAGQMYSLKESLMFFATGGLYPLLVFVLSSLAFKHDRENMDDEN